MGIVMTELSPNAQAIFDAVWNEPTYEPGGWEVSYRFLIAAAFRAAVRRLSYGGALSDVDAGFVIDECALLAIADELDPPLET
jgi:hypothetical protein